jgi:hypothetical protein
VKWLIESLDGRRVLSPKKHLGWLTGCGKLKAVFDALEDRHDQFSMEDEERCLVLLQ